MHLVRRQLGVPEIGIIEHTGEVRQEDHPVIVEPRAPLAGGSK